MARFRVCSIVEISSSGRPKMKITDDVDVGALNVPDDFEDLDLAERLLGPVANMLASRFDPQRKPLHAGASKLRKHAWLHRVDPGIRPYIQAVIATDELVAQSGDVPFVQHEHF